MKRSWPSPTCTHLRLQFIVIALGASGCNPPAEPFSPAPVRADGTPIDPHSYLSPTWGVTIRELLDTDTDWDEVLKELVALGSFAFPVYSEILEDDKSRPGLISAVLSTLCSQNTDRRMFLPATLRYLGRPEESVRGNALTLLSQIGSRGHELSIIPLLYDKEPRNVMVAGDALVILGGDNALAALTQWLESPPPKTTGADRTDIAKCQRDLKARLEKEEAEKKKAEPPKK